MLPQGPRSSKVLQTVRWLRKPIDVLEDAAARFGTPFTLRRLGNRPAVIVSDPEHVRTVFRSAADMFLTGVANEGFRFHIGPHSILSMDGAEHKRHRRIVNPAFQEDRIRAYAETTWNKTVAMVDRWQVGEEVNLLHAMHALKFDLILETVFGISNPEFLSELRRLAAILSRESSSIVMYLPFLRTDLGRFNRWGRYLRARREWDRILYEEIERARRDPAARSDILGLLVRQGPKGSSPLTSEEIHDELMTFLAVGHATTAVALAWTFQWVLSSEDATRRVIEEVRERVGEGFHPDSLEDLSYVDAVILETLRLNPPVLLMVRQLDQAATIAGFDLPRGTLVRPCPYLTHRDPRIFPDPERFLPERFLGRRPSPYEYYPFGGGPRYCVGASYALQQMRIILAGVMAHVDLSLLTKPTRDYSRFSLLVAPAHGTPARVERRHVLVPEGSRGKVAVLG